MGDGERLSSITFAVCFDRLGERDRVPRRPAIVFRMPSSARSEFSRCQTKVWGTANQHALRINLRRIEPFALIRLGWH